MKTIENWQGKTTTDLTLLQLKTELEKFFKFNVIKSVPHAPWGAEIMRTTWVITEKTDNLSKTESKVKAVGAVPFICHKEKLPVGDINSNKM